MVTIYDIAKACNCSSATVSKVLSRSGNLSEKTYEGMPLLDYEVEQALGK